MANVSITSTMKAKLLYKPVAGLVQSGIISSDAYSSTPQSFTNPVTTYWDSGLLNTQGQIWQAVNSGDHTQGCINAATPRMSGGVYENHITEFEFLFTGNGFDLHFVGSSYYDAQVYIEYGNRMYKAQNFPISGTTTGTMYRSTVFANPYHGRVRIVLGGGTFVGIGSEQSAIIKPSPLRQFAICDGGEFSDGMGTHQSSGVSYLTAGLCDYLFERTGMVWARRGQAHTGFFTNGTSTVTTDAAAADNSTRWFSASRQAWMATDLTSMPIFYLCIGTQADGGISGATGLSTGPMAVRALACYQWVRSQDALCTLAQVSPSPFTGSGAAGTLTGPPTASNGHDLNRQEQKLALAAVARSVYVNSFGPTYPWWVGTGSNGTPTTSQQAILIGADATNMVALGYNFYASKITADLGEAPVNLMRARGQG